MDFTTNITIGDEEDVEVNVECSVSAFRPGKYSGLPENCYPDEGGEVEDVKVTLDGKDITDTLSKEAMEHVERVAFEIAEDSAIDDYDPPDDEYYDDPALDYIA